MKKGKVKRLPRKVNKSRCPLHQTKAFGVQIKTSSKIARFTKVCTAKKEVCKVKLVSKFSNIF